MLLAEYRASKCLKAISDQLCLHYTCPLCLCERGSAELVCVLLGVCGCEASKLPCCDVAHNCCVHTVAHAKTRSGASDQFDEEGEQGINPKEGCNPIPSVWPLCSGTVLSMEAAWISTACASQAPAGSCDLSCIACSWNSFAAVNLQDPTRYSTATTTVTAQRMLKHSQNVTAVQQHNKHCN